MINGAQIPEENSFTAEKMISGYLGINVRVLQENLRTINLVQVSVEENRKGHE